tara:strand:- start:96 stop:464 length:369 start_codon:yes stop_codon:yes gene_type:complete
VYATKTLPAPKASTKDRNVKVTRTLHNHCTSVASATPELRASFAKTSEDTTYGIGPNDNEKETRNIRIPSIAMSPGLALPPAVEKENDNKAQPEIMPQIPIIAIFFLPYTSIFCDKYVPKQI